MPEAALDLARSHVADANRFVKRQQTIVAELTRCGDDLRTLSAASVLLREMTAWRRLAERHLEHEEAASHKLLVRSIRSNLLPGELFWPPDEAAPLDGPLLSIEESSRRAIARSRTLLLHSK